MEFRFVITNIFLVDVKSVKNVRIFTPVREMKFAGHPTIGSSWVIISEGVVPPNQTAFSLSLKIGVVPIVFEPERELIWLTTPPISFGSMFKSEDCARILGLTRDDLLHADDIPPQLVTAGISRSVFFLL